MASEEFADGDRCPCKGCFWDETCRREPVACGAYRAYIGADKTHLKDRSRGHPTYGHYFAIYHEVTI